MGDETFPPISVHRDPEMFREAVEYTASNTRFSPRLIEKDYFCSLLLARLSAAVSDSLIFKGGTCLAKVHTEFFRLSEDLDFSIPMPVDSSRSHRRAAILPVKDALEPRGDQGYPFRVLDALTGADANRQYQAAVGYEPVAMTGVETIKLEFGLREPLLLDSVVGMAKTILLNPVNGTRFVEDVPIKCMSLEESIAEKFRAALTRRDVAIRDFYDLFSLFKSELMDPTGERLVRLVRAKLEVTRTAPIIVSTERLREVRTQVQTRLRPVLRDADFTAFDVDSAIDIVTAMANRCG